MPNRLANETSPYLLQHKDNPVDWFPWGQEAFTRAMLEDKPVFLSVGYASCHWCHVMEHESFADEEVAAILNEHFVCVKVDREERPDIDDAYMTAVHLMSGRGGWPMTLILTPQKKPFVAGTYFPKQDRGQVPGLITLARGVAQAWQVQREEIERSAQEIDGALRQAMARTLPPETEAQLDTRLIEAAVGAFASEYDQEHHGFGSAPKFPPHTAIELLTNVALMDDLGSEPRQIAMGMSVLTLAAMCLGGIHDHVGGGFHRYATDANWHLPHFEKMLGDNALMLTNLATAAELLRGNDDHLSSLFRRAADGIVHWMETEMMSPEGLFYSALDADSEGHEGAYYVWTEAEIKGALLDRWEPFARAYGVEAGGNFLDEATRQRTGANVLHLVEDDGGVFAADLQRLRTSRERRPRPALDDKVLVGLNGLAIRGLLRAGRPDLATRCAEALLEIIRVYEEVPRQFAQGKASGHGYLEDYAALALAMFELGFVTEDLRYIDLGTYFTDQMMSRFYDEEAGGFFSTSSKHEALFGRMKPVFDQPVPSGNAMAMQCLVYARKAEQLDQSATALLPWVLRAPTSCAGLLSAMTVFAGASVEESAPDEVEPEGATEVQDLPTIRIAEVTGRLASRELVAGADGWAHGAVELDIPDGLHLYANPAPDRWSTATKLTIVPVRSRVEYPESGDGMYRGALRIPYSVCLESGESGADYEVEVTIQECTDSECREARTMRFSALVVR